MHQKVYTLQIKTQKDMGKLEQTVASLLGGEYNKCSFIRSQDFITLRLLALYTRADEMPREHMVVVYGEGLKITLDPENNASDYLVSPSIEAEPSLQSGPLLSLGKRACPDTGNTLDSSLD